jgi:hypothetical protein
MASGMFGLHVAGSSYALSSVATRRYEIASLPTSVRVVGEHVLHSGHLSYLWLHLILPAPLLRRCLGGEKKSVVIFYEAGVT